MAKAASQSVGGTHGGPWDDHRWDTLVALHPGVITEVARGDINVFNGGRSLAFPKNMCFFSGLFLSYIPFWVLFPRPFLDFRSYTRLFL